MSFIPFANPDTAEATIPGQQTFIPFSNPATAEATVPTNTSGQVLGEWTGGNTAAGSQTVDPYAQWGGQTGYNNLMNSYNTQQQGVHSGAGESASTYGASTDQGVRHYLQNLGLGQQGIDNKAVNNEMALRQGREGVTGMVGRGIQSGGVMLANKNASDSSAAGAIARAYGDIGRRQLSGVNNQYEMQNRNIGQEQNAFNVKKNQDLENFQLSKQQKVNELVTGARNAFADIQARMTSDKLTPGFNPEVEKEKVRQDVLSKLAGLDAQFARINTVNPTDMGQRRTQALQNAQAGQAPADSFSFTDQMPAQFQGAGLPSELPLFSTPRKRTG